MRRILLAAILGLGAVAAPQAAHAQPPGEYVKFALPPTGGPGYDGGCAVAVALDITPGGLLGGQHTWDGVVAVAVHGTIQGDDPSAVSCWIKINGGSEYPILDGTQINPLSPFYQSVETTVGGLTVGAGTTAFASDVTDTVSLCTHVTTRTYGATDRCYATTTMPVCPDQVCGGGGAIDRLDSVVCPALIIAAPAVNGLPTAGVLYVDPATGDTLIRGTSPDYRLWDCPPYALP